ncbi:MULTISPECIES: hypothetical protein [unclassified Methanosarcina]|nr:MULTISPECIES: hypothetical protein [unclassified Methanosarcina]
MRKPPVKYQGKCPVKISRELSNEDPESYQVERCEEKEKKKTGIKKN